MRVLIVEDEPIIALEIESIVLERLPNAHITLAGSVAAALAAVDDTLDMAFLDIDVTDGKTYSVALELRLRHVPFAFVSGAKQADAPEGLKEAGFIPKPFSAADVADAVDRFMRDGDRK